MNVPPATLPGDLRDVPEAACRQPIRVLLIEDNEGDAALILRMLRRGGYEPEWVRVETPQDLDAELARCSWDIVLSDYSLPGFDALRALHRLREQSAYVPFIIISGSIGEETAVAAMRAGASDYLMKTNLTRLVPAIEREMRDAAGRRERTRTRSALLDLQEKFQVIFREYLDVMVVLDAASGEVLHVNHAILPMMGFDERLLAGQPFSRLWPKDQKARADAVLAEVRAKGSAFYSGDFIRLDGSLCPMDLQANKVPWGWEEAVIVTLRDVSERQCAAQRLAVEKEQLAVTLRSIGEGVITTDTGGRIVLVNGVAEHLTGWTQAAAAGQPLRRVLRLFSIPGELPCNGRVEEVLRNGRTLELNRSVALRASDGARRSLSLTASPIRGQDGCISGVVAIFRDVTAELKAEEELQNASRLESVGLLAGGIAHDFNNILTAILGHISLAKASASLPNPTMASIERACVYATDLTRQLLTFAKGSTPNRCVEAINEVIREGVEFAAHGSTLRCVFDLPEDLYPVEVDRSQIHQVINNLVINAAQAAPERGELHVEARNVSVTREEPVPTLRAGRYVRISLRDNGCGIPPESLARIFDPYFTTKAEGSGLGLATAYSIIRKHDGLIQVDSQPGGGSTFRIYLPAAAAQTFVPAQGADVDGAAPPASPAAPERSGRILFMDDEEVLQELVGAMLGYLGFEVECAAHGDQAIERFVEARRAGRAFSAVIVDLTVPGGMGGFETVRRLRELDPHLKAIVSSGYSNDPIMADYAQYGFNGVIAKPYQMEELAEVLREVISPTPQPA